MSLHPGQVVLGHTVAAFHKQGGSGIVYSGTDSAGKRVAVKFIRTDGAGAIPAELDVVRFVSEHPHPSLVRILRYGAVDGGHVIVMEWADESLQDRLNAVILAGEPMAVRKALGLVKRVADGLDYLDVHKYAHHDVKPGNVLLVDGQPKLSDFGFAQLASASLTSMSMSFKGTPHYLAPEVCDNRSARNRSDQYSLAVMYYWLRRNESPYRELRGQVELSPVGLIKVHTSAVPDLEGLTDGERAAVARALSKDPKDRFPTCSAFVSELIRTAHLPRVTARPTKPWRRKLIDLNASVRTLESVNGDLRSRARRERRWRFALLGLLVLGLCGLGWLGTLVVPPSPELPAPPTREEFDRLTAEVARNSNGLAAAELGRRLFEAERETRLLSNRLDEELAARPVTPPPKFSAVEKDFENLPIGTRPPALDCTIDKGVDAKTVRTAQLAWAKYLDEDHHEKEFEVTFLTKPSSIQMILIPPGKYTQSAGDAVATVLIAKAMWVGKHEVTQHQYSIISPKQRGLAPAFKIFRTFDGPKGKAEPVAVSSESHPMEFVTHAEAVEFCQIADLATSTKFRLLTENEWEYVYRAGTRTKFYNGAGDKAEKVEEIAVCVANSEKKPAKIGTKPANAFGVHDMAGNVAEWCIARPVDLKQGYLPYRGGSFREPATNCGADSRQIGDADTRASDIGFRVCIPIDK